MRLLFIAFALVGLSACASTPDLSTFKSQGEALTTHVGPATSFIPTRSDALTERQDRTALEINNEVPPFQVLNPALFCQQLAEDVRENTAACNEDKVNANLVADRIQQITDMANAYSARVADYAAAGELEDGEAGVVGDALEQLLSFARESPLPTTNNAVIGLIDAGLQQLRQNRRNKKLGDLVRDAQPAVDAIAVSIWAALGYCDVELPAKMRERRADLANLPCGSTNSSHANLVSLVYSYDVAAAERIPERDQFNAQTIIDGQSYSSLMLLDSEARAAFNYLASGCDTDVPDCSNFESAEDARQTYELHAAISDALDRHNRIVAQANADRLERMRAGQNLAAAYLNWAQGHAQLPELISESRAFTLDGLFNFSQTAATRVAAAAEQNAAAEAEATAAADAEPAADNSEDSTNGS